MEVPCCAARYKIVARTVSRQPRTPEAATAGQAPKSGALTALTAQTVSGYRPSLLTASERARRFAGGTSDCTWFAGARM